MIWLCESCCHLEQGDALISHISGGHLCIAMYLLLHEGLIWELNAAVLSNTE